MNLIASVELFLPTKLSAGNFWFFGLSCFLTKQKVINYLLRAQPYILITLFQCISWECLGLLCIGLSYYWYLIKYASFIHLIVNSFHTPFSSQTWPKKKILYGIFQSYLTQISWEFSYFLFLAKSVSLVS